MIYNMIHHSLKSVHVKLSIPTIFINCLYVTQSHGTSSPSHLQPLTDL